MTPYSTTPIDQAWTDRRTLELWTKVEIALLRTQAETGLIPAQWAGQATATPPPSVERWRQATYQTGHEVVGFLQAWGVHHVHIGITSSDLIDTANALRYKEINDTIETDTYRLREALIQLTERTIRVPRAGRTHGQIATETTLGHKFADITHQAHRAARRLTAARHDLELGMLNGPTGGYHHIDPQTERQTLAQLGLQPHPATTQIAPRDSLTHYAATLIGIVQTCAALATEIRLTQHHQTAETNQPETNQDYQGSSSMPDKQNPTPAERITGLARIARNTYPALAESTEQWHERDISQSSVERVLMPQLTGITHYCVLWATDTAKRLQPDEARTAWNLWSASPRTNAHSAMTRAQVIGKPYFEARQTKPDYQPNQPADTKHTLQQLRKLGSTP